jgi:hypothetical protein
MTSCFPLRGYSLGARSGIIGLGRVLCRHMELRTCERPEPSHIHIPRPSRQAKVEEHREDLAVVACAPRLPDNKRV